MARPEKNTVAYFPFYCEDGKKMYYLEETYGNDGFATFVKLLRELAKTEYHYLNLNEKTTQMFLASKCKVSKETLISIINDLVDLGKFDAILWNENKIIWCQDFIDSIQDAYEKRKNKCITFDGLLQLLIGLGVRKPQKQPLKGDGNTQIKEDKKKEKEIKEDNIPTLNEFLEFSKEKLNGTYSEFENSLKLKYDAWVSNDWKDGYNKKITNWKTKLLNTIPHLKKETKGTTQINHNTLLDNF